MPQLIRIHLAQSSRRRCQAFGRGSRGGRSRPGHPPVGNQPRQKSRRPEFYRLGNGRDPAAGRASSPARRAARAPRKGARLNRDLAGNPQRRLPREFVDALPPQPPRAWHCSINLGMGRREIAYLLGLSDVALEAAHRRAEKGCRRHPGYALNRSPRDIRMRQSALPAGC